MNAEPARLGRTGESIVNTLMRLLLAFALLLAVAVELAAQDKLKETSYYPQKVGNTLCAFLETERDGKVVGSEHVAVGDDGVYRHDLTVTAEKTAAQKLNPPILVFKLPPKKGDSWKIDSKVDGKTFRGTFQVGEQEITVPAGTYKAFRVASQDLEVNSLKPAITTFFAEGVGMVKQIIEIGNAKVEIELEKIEEGGKKQD
jgi:hypothetical protein